ncbi:MAG: divalent metal cation transporter [Planctomycetaceae bacterium]
MTHENSRLEQDRQAILDARKKGLWPKLWTYTRMSGPGWLQGAITLGGGSLAGSLYLGIIGGYEMMWLQPLMMIFGIAMLSAIGYVALSTQKSPFHEMNQHVSPVLGWGWAIATLMANLVWAMPQFSLGTAAMQQNLGVVPETSAGQWTAIGILFGISFVVVWFYDSGGWGIKLFEILLKVLVGIIVLSFFAVVVAMTVSGKEGLPWNEIFSGFIPNPDLLWAPAESLKPLVANSSDPAYWEKTLISAQRDRMVAAAATAVGINMTFLLPYSMLKKGWDKDFRGLATFDLSIGLFIPFLLATSCVVIAAASQFHGKPEPALLGKEERTAAVVKLEASFKKNLDGLLKQVKSEAEIKTLTAGQKAHDEKVKAKQEELAKTKSADELKAMVLKDPNLGLGFGPLDQARNDLRLEDKKLAATLIQRDAFALANSLEKLAGRGIAQIVFGIGVVGMALSTIIILMLINGFTICEMLSRPSKGWLHRFGCLLPGLSGALGFVYLWTDSNAKFYLAVPTSRFGMVLLPIAYIAFLLLINNRKVLGEEIPRGGKRLFINVMLTVAVVLALIGAGMSIFNDQAKLPNTEIRVRDIALGLVGALVVAAIAVQVMRKPKPS